MISFSSVTSRKKRKKVNISRVIFIISFIILPIINFLLFYVYVNMDSFFMAFQTTKNGVTVWTLENFARFFREFSLSTSTIRIAFKNTFLTFGINLIMFPVGFFVSFFLYKKIFLYKTFRTIFFMPSIIAGTIISSVFMKIVGTQGPIAKIVQDLYHLDYVPDVLNDSRFANTFVLMQMVWLNFPGSMIIWGGTFSRIPTSVIEAARLDGVNWVQEAFQIIIPVVWPTFALQLMLTFVGMFGSSGNVFLLTKGEFGTQTLSNWMYMQVYGNTAYGGNNNAFCYLSAVGLLISAVAITLSLTIRRITNKVFQDVEY